MLRLGCGAWALALVRSCAGAVFAEFAAASRGASPGSEAHGGAGGIVHCTSISGIAAKHATLPSCSRKMLSHVTSPLSAALPLSTTSAALPPTIISGIAAKHVHHQRHCR